jgi:hypothetical protein
MEWEILKSGKKYSVRQDATGNYAVFRNKGQKLEIEADSFDEAEARFECLEKRYAEEIKELRRKGRGEKEGGKGSGIGKTIKELIFAAGEGVGMINDYLYGVRENMEMLTEDEPRRRRRKGRRKTESIIDTPWM